VTEEKRELEGKGRLREYSEQLRGILPDAVAQGMTIGPSFSLSINWRSKV
jgi:hypothetical protein